MERCDCTADTSGAFAGDGHSPSLEAPSYHRTHCHRRCFSCTRRRRGFSFVGPTTVFALMEAIGVVDTHLLDRHRRGCSALWNPTRVH